MNQKLPVFVLSRAVALLAILVLALLDLSPARAAAAEPVIVVHSTGTASARPTQVEISGKLSADAELAADAVVKFHDAKKRALAAMAALKNADLSVIPGGVAVGSGMDANAQMMAMRGMSVPSTGQKVRIGETSRIVLDHADKLEPDELLEKVLKILDAAKDAGFQIGPAPTTNYYETQLRAAEGDEGAATVSFKLPDVAALRKKACKAAIDDAKAKAQELADLSGVKLGRIISVQDVQTIEKQDSATSAMMMIYGIMANKRSDDDKALVSGRSGEVMLRVNLRVEFELVK